MLPARYGIITVSKTLLCECLVCERPVCEHFTDAHVCVKDVSTMVRSHNVPTQSFSHDLIEVITQH